MATIEIVEGYHKGKVVDFLGSATLGRAPNNALCLHDSRASRQHALIRTSPDGEGYMLSDLGSGNGTYVGSVKLEPGIPHRLQNGDIITIASTRLVFHMEAPAEPAVSEKKKKSSSIFLDGDPVPVVMEMQEGGAPAIRHSLDASRNMLDAQGDEGDDVIIRRLRAMVELAGDFSALPGQEAILDRILDKILDVFPQADRTFIMTRRSDTGEIVPMIGRQRRAAPEEQKRFPVSRTIIDKVIKEKTAVLSADAAADFGAKRSIADFGIHSIMCAPMLCQGEMLGLINVDSMNPDDRFGADDLTMLAGIAAQAATAIRNAGQFDQLEAAIHTRSHLSRYMPVDVAKGVVDGAIKANIGSQRADGTFLACSLAGFSHLSLRMPPATVVERMGRYFHIATDIISRNKGIMENFGGDTITAFWNLMFKDDQAEEHAISAALQMLSSIWYFNLDLRAEGRSPLSTCIALNTGEMTAGNIGGERVEFAIVGPHKDLARLLLSRAGHWQVLATRSTFAPSQGQCSAVALPELEIAGLKLDLVSVRGQLAGKDRMTLSIPVRVLDAKEALLGDGFITGSAGASGDRRLFFSSEALVVPGQPIHLDLDLVEYDEPLRISGVVEDESRQTFYGQAAFSKSTLKGLKGDDTVFAFLGPGSLLKSSRDWESIGRR